MLCPHRRLRRRSIRSALRAPVRALAACLLICAAANAGAEGEAAASLGCRLGWAVIHKHGDEAPRPIDYERRVVRLQSGDRIRLQLRPLSSCHLYVYLYDSQKRLYLLFPQGSPSRAGPCPGARTFALPGGDNWYRLDEHGGVELFYLIVSEHRQQALEAATEELLRADPASALRARRVLEEIKRLIREGSRLAGAQEKPIAVAGDFRGVGEDGEFPGRMIEARGVYVRTFRLQH